MHQNPNVIPRLVYDFLIKSGYNSTANVFAAECPYLSGLKQLADNSGAKILQALVNPNLFDIVESFFTLWEGKAPVVSKDASTANFTCTHVIGNQYHSEAKNCNVIPGEYCIHNSSNGTQRVFTDVGKDTCISTNLNNAAISTHPLPINSLQNQFSQSQNISYSTTLQSVSRTTNQNVPSQNQLSLNAHKISVRNLKDMLAPPPAEITQSQSMCFPPTNCFQTKAATDIPMCTSGISNNSFPSNHKEIGHLNNTRLNLSQAESAYRAQSVHHPPLYCLPLTQSFPNVQSKPTEAVLQEFPPYNPARHDVAAQSLRATTCSMTNAVPPTPSRVSKPTPAQSSGLVKTNAPADKSQQSFQANREFIKDNCNRLMQALIKIFHKQPEPVASHSKELLLGLLSGKIDAERFTLNLQQALSTTFSPSFGPFLKKYLPFLKYFLSTKELSYDEINGTTDKRASNQDQLAIPLGPVTGTQQFCGTSTNPCPEGAVSRIPNRGNSQWNASPANTQPMYSENELSHETCINNQNTIPRSQSTVDHSLNLLLMHTNPGYNVSAPSNPSSFTYDPILVAPSSKTICDVRATATTATSSFEEAKIHSTPLNELCKVAVWYSQRIAALRKETGTEEANVGAQVMPVAASGSHQTEIEIKTEAITNENVQLAHTLAVNNEVDTKLASADKIVDVAKQLEGSVAFSPCTTDQTCLGKKPLGVKVSSNVSNRAQISGDGTAKKSMDVETLKELHKKKIISNSSKTEKKKSDTDTHLSMVSPLVTEVNCAAGPPIETASSIPNTDPTVKLRTSQINSLLRKQQGSSNGVKTISKVSKKRQSEHVPTKENPPEYGRKASKRKLADADPSDAYHSGFCDGRPQKKRNSVDIRPCSVVLRPIFRVRLPEGTFEISM